MKRPLVVITAGFVLERCLPCVCRRLYTEYFSGLQECCFDSACCQAVLSRSVMYRTLLLILCLFWRDDGRKFFRRQVPGTDGAGRKRIIQAGFGDVVQLTAGSGCTGKSEKLEIIVNQVKVGKRVRNIADPDDIRWLSLQYPVQLSGTPGDLEGWEEKLLPGKQVKMACSFRLTEPAKIRGI